MCERCDVTKAALDHVVVAALKIARLTEHEMVVGFIGSALVMMPSSPTTIGAIGGLVARVRHTSTAAELKSQIQTFMEDPFAHYKTIEDSEVETRDLSVLFSDVEPGLN